ncbi:hypothetical protein EK904_005026 [Melospiza melodia maxima]|nr:hypothetical protein EK904_005026 [Melospiza melodia maxima]
MEFVLLSPVVYEHRSRLERSLQKERGEHKKTKEDFLVYKLEAQEALNKEKQDSMNRYGALSSQHKILKCENGIYPLELTFGLPPNIPVRGRGSA